jgi:3-hydroxy acid dehydrogenase/malonic semialdehyde reductase
MKLREIIVTGASSGIGLATAKQLLDLGHSVVGICRRKPSIQHRSFNWVPVDLAAADAGASLAQASVRHPGIDAVISVAGGGQFGSLENFSPLQIEKSIAQNLISHMIVARTFITRLKKQSHGNLIFMGSEAALSGSRQGSLYCAAKFGLRGFAQSLRQECASAGVHVGIVNPGMVRSEFFEALSFEPGGDDANALAVNDVVAAILLMLNARSNAVIEEINLSPLKSVVSKK